MEFKSFYLEKLRIKNFLSFYGNQEVNLLPFTAITSTYSKGAEDMLAAIEFVLCGNLKKIQTETPIKLLHRIFWKQLEIGSEIECCVEITLKFASDELKMKLYKGVKKSGFTYKIDDKFVCGSFYEDVLDCLNINSRKKNIILYKSFFDAVIWGARKDFEMFLTKMLRMNSRLKEWKKMKVDIDNLKKLKNIAVFEKRIEKMKKNHGIIEKFTENFNSFLMKRDYFRGSFNRISFNQVEKENGEDNYDIQSLQHQLHSLLESFDCLQIKESKLLSELYIYELKISLANDKILQERILKLKSKLKNLEIHLSSLWSEMKEFEHELNELNNKISVNLAILWDLQQLYYLENRLTKYGRFIDYLQPFEFIHLLKQIIGDSILYGNLCDDFETAKSYCEHLRAVKYDKREEFVIFENYSFRLKDLLLGSGEKGIKIKNVQDLQIFLCRLKQYGLIEIIPVISKGEFTFNMEEGRKSRDIIYPESGIFIRSDGTISYAKEINIDFDHKFLVKNVNQFLIQQELKYEEYRDLIFQRQITIQSINVLENDINYFKFHYKQRNNNRPKENKIYHQLSDVYNEYKKYFAEHERNLKDAARECREFEKFSFNSGESGIVGDSDVRKRMKMKEAIDNASRALYKIENEKEEVRIKIMNVKKNLRFSSAFSHKIWFPPVKKYVLLEQPKKICNFYYDMEYTKLQRIMSEDEVEEFENWKGWRKSTIDSLTKNVDYFTKLLKNSKINFDNLTMERRKILSPILEHCNLNLSSAANLIADVSFPFLKLVMNHSDDGLELVSSFTGSKDEIIEIGHFNSFLKFIAALVLFMEISNYERVPILLLDNLKEFLPHYKNTFEAASDKSEVTSDENTYFQMLARIAQYLGFFIKKNGANQSAEKSSKAGPIQIIYLTSEDLVHAADHHLWIRNMILPDEFITDVSDSYSIMEQINFE